MTDHGMHPNVFTGHVVTVECERGGLACGAVCKQLSVKGRKNIRHLQHHVFFLQLVEDGDKHFFLTFDALRIAAFAGL